MVSMSMTQYDYTISTQKDKLQFLTPTFTFLNQVTGFYFILFFVFVYTDFFDCVNQVLP